MHPGGFLSPNELPFGEYLWCSLLDTHSHTPFYLHHLVKVMTCIIPDWFWPETALWPLTLSLCVLRNLSSVNEKTRQQMRETHRLVDCLVGYIKASINENKAEDKVSQEAMELHLSRCFCSTQILCIHLFVCVFVGGGKCSVCPEEPLLPALWWDASICFDAPGRTNQSSGLRKGWSHWLLHTSEQESQKCTHTWD